MNSDDLRTEYLKFFEEKGHLILPSSSLIPIGDPTLLLTSAGVVQIKPFFTGEAIPPNPRLVSAQKCFRTTDIDSVGDADHLTFFEMLGNFSVGDYFKKEAIDWAWEFVTKELNLPPERLWISIFLDDDESFDLWQDVGVPAHRIVRYGEEDNYWGPPGDEGPCGPCSEIYYDFGPEHGCNKPDCERNPACSCGRFTEIWNLVFTQYYQDLQGERILLPKPNIDTGMGLERTAAVLQGVTTVYETDVFAEIMEAVSRLTGKEYAKESEDRTAMRVLAEHSRGLTYLIADGVVPSNEGRGYVLRRILRRAVTFARRLDVDRVILPEIAKTVIDKMGHVYPELERNREFILKVIDHEESRFHDTLDTGLSLLDQMVSQERGVGPQALSGSNVFKLYDTYGFPPELTREVAAEKGLTVDMEGFHREMEHQRERGRAVQVFKTDKMSELYGSLGLGATRFTGYETLKGESVVVGLLVEGLSMQRVTEGQRAELVVMETPFYAEGGGQVGDRGEIEGLDGTFRVEDTQITMPGFIVHRGTVMGGTISAGESVSLRVHSLHRREAARNHTATHLLHAALRKVLGGHVRQSGSLVEPARLRFDFTHPVGLSNSDLKDVREMVNRQVRDDLQISSRQLPYNQAVSEGALAFFGDKYPDVVRVVEMGDGEWFSLEVCGGTHVGSTGDVWYFQIMDEGSIGSGLRRIEAVTGTAVEHVIDQRLALVDSLSRELGTPPSELGDKVSSLVSELESERKRAANLERELARGEASDLLGQVQHVDGINVLAARVKAPNVETMREMGDLVKARMGEGIVVLASVISDRPLFVAMVTPDLVAKGFHAGKIAQEVAAEAGGGGGGRPEMAQAGGKDKSKIQKALDAVAPTVKGVRA